MSGPSFPRSIENYRRSQKSGQWLTITEVRLYSDAHFIDDAYGLGPYDFLNTVAHGDQRHRDSLKPCIVLRYRNFLPAPHALDGTKTRDDLYHGGTELDELAALGSLYLDARLMAGPWDRVFEPRGDPLGRPTEFEFSREPTLTSPSGGMLIPHLLGERNLKAILDLKPVFDCLHDPDAATAVVKSARLYQEAIWASDADPNFSWLFLVSAIETAAGFSDKVEVSDLEGFQRSLPRVASILAKGGAEHLIEQIAKELKPIVGSTGKFIRFLDRFAPRQRPVNQSIPHSPFDYATLRKAASKIYEYRSHALHGGKPFPAPMCRPPYAWAGTFAEIPMGLATGVADNVWLLEDTPMLLHVFARIVRQSLLKWIDHLCGGELEVADGG